MPNYNSGTWTAWCDNTSSATTLDTTTAWEVWASSTGGTEGSSNTVRYEFRNDAESAAQRLAREEQQRVRDAGREEREKRYRLEAAARKAKTEKADATAKELLLSLLTNSQRKSLDEMSAIVVKSELGKTYKIKYGTHGNVKELDDKGDAIASFCIQPRGVPKYDVMASQLLMLQTDEAAFLRIANKTAIRNMRAA